MLRVLRQAVGDNASLSWTWCALAMGFPICLSGKRPSHGLGVCLQWAFPPACRGKGRLMDLVCACDGLFSLPVEERAVSWSWWALAMGFSSCLSRKRPSHVVSVQLDGISPLPVEENSVSGGFPLCLSRKRPSHGLGARLRWAFPPACRGKDHLMDLVCA